MNLTIEELKIRIQKEKRNSAIKTRALKSVLTQYEKVLYAKKSKIPTILDCIKKEIKMIKEEQSYLKEDNDRFKELAEMKEYLETMIPKELSDSEHLKLINEISDSKGLEISKKNFGLFMKFLKEDARVNPQKASKIFSELLK